MDFLEPYDVMHLHAAEGWLGFGNTAEANEELEKITPAMRSHPDVLEVRYEIYAKAQRWNECLDIASAIVRMCPEITFGWIQRSFALHELKRTKEAQESLLTALAFFPEEITIHYNLACYECTVGNLGRAKLHLAEAFNLAENQNCFDHWRLQCLGDPDLESLWGYLDAVEI